MMAACELAALRQELVEVATPAGGIGDMLANEAARLGRVEDGFNSAAKARRRFRRAFPQRLQD